MGFETNRDVLEWYEGQERSLTPEFLSAIPWDDVKKHAVDERFIPVLLYMRDVETLTDMYHRELIRTPTGRDPHISKFMERWGVEEITHGEVLNRFLNEAGYETDADWQTQVRRDVTTSYRVNAFMVSMVTHLIGKKFTATHMTIGAVHEMEAAQGYRRLMAAADHPVLTHILQAIIREESAHNKFYWSIARLELGKNETARKIARLVLEKFWQPVGQGSLNKSRTNYILRTLFAGDGVDVLEKTVTKRVQQLPGFAGYSKVTDHIGGVVRAGLLELEAA